MPWPRALGIVADRLLVAQRPSFWIEFGARLGKALLPLAWRYVSKRLPAEEDVWREAERRGQGDEWSRGRFDSEVGELSVWRPYNGQA